MPRTYRAQFLPDGPQGRGWYVLRCEDGREIPRFKCEERERAVFLAKQLGGRLQRAIEQLGRNSEIRRRSLQMGG